MSVSDKPLCERKHYICTILKLPFCDPKTSIYKLVNYGIYDPTGLFVEIQITIAELLKESVTKTLCETRIVRESD